MNKIKGLLIAVVAIVVVLGGVFYFFASQTSHVKVIPANTSAVLKINTKKLAHKAKVKKISEDEFIKKVIDELPLSEEARKEIEKVVKNPLNSGINFLANLYVFVTPPENKKDMDKALVGFTAPLVSKKKFEKAINDIAKALGDESGALYKEEDGISFVEINSSVAVGWNKKAFLVLSAPDCMDDDYILKTLKERLKASRKESVLSNKNFRKFNRKGKDIGLWVSTNVLEDLFKDELKEAVEDLDPTILEAIKKQKIDIMKCLPDNYAHIFVNFEKGAIRASANFTFNKELKKALKGSKIAKYGADSKLLAALPGNNPLFVFQAGAHKGKLKKEMKKAEKELKKDPNVKGVLPMVEASINMKLIDILTYFTGSIGLVISDVDMSTGEPIPTMTLALTVKNNKLFEKLMTMGKAAGAIKKDGDAYTMAIPGSGITLFTSCKKNIWKVSNNKEFATKANLKKKSLKKEKAIVKKLKKSSALAYLNLDTETLPKSIQELIKSELSGSEYKMLKKYWLFKSLSISNTKKNTIEAELAFKNKKDNALYQLINTGKDIVKANFDF